MMLFEDLKQEFQSWHTSAQVLSGFAVIISGVFSFLFNFLDSFIPKEYLTVSKFFILFIGIAILVWKTTGVIIFSISKSSLVVVDNDTFSYKYSPNKRFAAKCVRWLILLFIPIFLVSGYNIEREKTMICLSKKNKTGISIGKFSKNSSDEFSANLLNFLSQEIRDSTVMLEFNNKFFGASASLNPKDSLSPLVECYNKGFVVYGSRNKYEGSFYCNIFLDNKSQFNENTRILGDTMFRIMEPRLIKFDIIHQAKTVGKFILSQIYYQQGRYENSLRIVEDLINKDSVLLDKDKKLKAHSYLLKGNNLLQQGNFEASASTFKVGLVADKTNEYLKLNLITAIKASKVEAKIEEKESGIRIFQDGNNFVITDNEDNVYAYGYGKPVRYNYSVIFPYKEKWCGIISIGGKIMEVVHKGKNVDIAKDSLDKYERHHK